MLRIPRFISIKSFRPESTLKAATTAARNSRREPNARFRSHSNLRFLASAWERLRSPPRTRAAPITCHWQGPGNDAVDHPIRHRLCPQYAQKGPVPAGGSKPMKTFLPKKKGNPQSKMPGLGPPRVGNTKLALTENNWLALPMVKLMVFELVPSLFEAERLTGDDGQ